MFRKQTILTLIGGMALMSLPAFSQEESLHRNEITAQAFGSFLKSTTNNGVDQSATNSGGILGSYRFLFTRYHGVEVDYGYSLNRQNFVSSGTSTGIKSHSHEVSASYVFRYPLRHWTPFVMAGAGALVFDPKDVTGVDSQARAAFVYGGGADFDLSRHVYLRAEYRGFVYNSPTYNLANLGGTDRITHRAEPSLGFGYRF
jgi:opacity protein-like surface antigen